MYIAILLYVNKRDVLFSAEKAEKMAELMKAVAHPLRLRIVALLCSGDERVTEICETLGVKQALVSQQLRILRMGGLVKVTKENGASRYTLAEPKLKNLIKCASDCRNNESSDFY